MRIAIALLGMTALAEADGFGPYPRARLLCSQHVTGKTMHITWTSHASSDSAEAIVKHYEKTTKRKATRGDKGEWNLAWDDNHKVAIYPVTKNDAFPHCDVKPTGGEKAVILISRAARGK
jgi:hypothetical protein